MGLELPTDTAAVRLATKQFELFGRRIGNGVDRTALAVGFGFGAPWVVGLWVAGVPVVSQLGPQLYLVPPFLVAYRGLRRDESGRISLLRWYDRLLAGTPGRRQQIGNPLLPAITLHPRPVEIIRATTFFESHAGGL